MKGLRNGEFVVSLALVASLVSHFAIQKHFERRARNAALQVEAQKPAALKAPMFQQALELAANDKVKLPRFLSEMPPESQIVPALDVQRDEPGERHAQVAGPPNTVPAPADAELTTTPPRREANEDGKAAVREVIEEELAHASPEEREIWYDELKSLPAGVVRDLLQVRKQLHALPRLLGSMPEKLASADPPMSARIQEITAEPASQRIRFNATDYHSAAEALETAISQLRHNLANSTTPGFKRLRVTLVDAYASSWRESPISGSRRSDSTPETRIQGEGCHMAPLVLDLKQGSLKKTGRQLDLAVEGEGFFVVRQGQKDSLTRCGALTLDRDRQLGLAITSEVAVLQPPIKIPDEAREIQISAQGIVMISKRMEASGDENTGGFVNVKIGQLQIGRVASPARLHPMGKTLLAANEATGEVTFGIPMADGLGEIHQGCLEQSNVEFERELEEIDTLSMILKALPTQSSHSATARSLPQAPQR